MDDLNKPLNVLTAGITIKNPDVMDYEKDVSKLARYQSDAPLEFIYNDDTASSIQDDTKVKLQNIYSSQINAFFEYIDDDSDIMSEDSHGANIISFQEVQKNMTSIQLDTDELMEDDVQKIQSEQ